jgi:hypothetical protein
MSTEGSFLASGGVWAGRAFSNRLESVENGAPGPSIKRWNLYCSYFLTGSGRFEKNRLLPWSLKGIVLNRIH